MRLGGSLKRRRKGRRARPGVGLSKHIASGRSIARKLTLKVAILSIVGWLFGYGISTRVLFPPPPRPSDLFEVPDVTGLGIASARERLAGAGLSLGTVDLLLHPTVPQDLILGQAPLPGQSARPSTDVRVSVSLGPQTRSVPDVVNLNEGRARIILETSGFLVTIDTAASELPRGSVIGVLPAPDSVVVLPTEARLLVSTGPSLIMMPLVLGLQETEATMVLDSIGLVVSDVEEVFRFGRDQGIVVEQEPASDIELERGTNVRLKVGQPGNGGEQ